jgi:integrase
MWDEIDLNTHRWTIPKTRMKMKKEHLVPLTEPAIEVIGRTTAFGKSGYVFKGEKEGRPFNLQVLGHALRREENQKILKQHGVKPFQPHDIRRTAATIMRRLGYGLVVDRVLAHVPKSVTDKHYDVHDYEPEKRTALEGLAKSLQAIEAKARAGK